MLKRSPKVRDVLITCSLEPYKRRHIAASIHLLVMPSPSAGPSGLSLEEQHALLREEQLRHVADLMESDEHELLV